MTMLCLASRGRLLALWTRKGASRCLVYDAWRRPLSTSHKDKKEVPKTPPSILPGVAICGSTAIVGFQAASVLSMTLGVPVSGIPVSILLGLAVRNTTNYPDVCKTGITFSTKAVLQGGIVAVAAKLSFVELMSTGSHGIPVVVGAVGAGLLAIPVMGRYAGLNKEVSLLLTAGTSICGVTAITALAPAIQASNRDTAVAVASTVAFGTMGMLAYPFLFHYLCGSSEQVGMCLGVAIHDTSQVLGSAMSYRDTFDDEIALKVATVTKLTRNLGLALAIPALTFSHRLSQTTSADGVVEEEKIETISGLVTFQKYVPPFLLAFIGMSTLRSCGDYFLLPSQDVTLYQDAMNFIGNDLSKAALGTAMAGVGLSTSAASLKGVGWRPFAVGGVGALLVGGTGFTIASMMAS